MTDKLNAGGAAAPTVDTAAPAAPVAAAPVAEAPAALPQIETVPATTSDPAMTQDQRIDADMAALYDKLNTPGDPDAKDGDAAGAEAQNKIDQPNAPVVEPVNTPAIDAPGAWSAEMKGQWSGLPAPVQEYVAQREREAHGRISKMGQELSQWKPIGELRQKYQDVLDRHGMTFSDGINRLLHAQTMLDQNPMQAIAAIAQTYGVDLAQAFGGQGGQQSQPMHPEFARVTQELSNVKAIITQQQREQLAQKTREQREMGEWAARTLAEWEVGKDHLDDVRDDMRHLLSTGAATDYDQAYSLAIQRNSGVKSKVDAKRQADEAAKARDQQAKAVKDAKRAATLTLGDRTATPKSKGKWDDDGYLSQLHDAVAARA